MKARLLPNDPSAVNIDGISRKPQDTGESEKLDNQFAFNNPRSLRRMYSKELASQRPELPARKSACGLDALSSPRRGPDAGPEFPGLLMNGSCRVNVHPRAYIRICASRAFSCA